MPVRHASGLCSQLVSLAQTQELHFRMGWSFALCHPGYSRSLKDSSVLTQEGQFGGVSAGLRQAFCAALVVTQANSAQHVDDSDGEVQVCNGCERESVFFVIQDCRKFKGCI